MKKIFLILISLFFTLHLFSQNKDKNFTAVRTEHAPKIDGELSDEIWKSANILTDFTQNIPNEGLVPTEKTEVKILYDDYAIYVYAMMYDNHPDSIYKELGVRDAYLRADLFRICFDTYNKQQDAYYFEVYASGVQRESKYSDGLYDAVWDSKVKILSNGWCVEMKIPYSALRFPSVNEQIWGFQTTRTIERKKEFDQWALIPKTVNNSLVHWGQLYGIKNINAPLRLSITPFFSTYYEKTPNTFNSNEKSYTKSISYNFGADLKYGIDEKFTLDLTLFPDFGQVQSDSKVKNLSYNEITYNENRSFFKEGTELFNTNSLFYSRRIGKTPKEFYQVESQLENGETVVENPSKVKLLNAIKVSGRNNNGLGIGVFNAVTDNMYATVENAEGTQRKILTEPLTNYNIIVFNQQLKNNSSAYIINTNVWRDKTFNHANVTASGLTLENKKHSYALDAFGILSQKFTKNDSLSNTYNDLIGYRYFIGIKKISGNFQFGASHTFINKTFDSRDLGYYITGNIMRERIYAGYYSFKPTKIYRENYLDIYADYSINPETGKRNGNTISLSNYTALLNYSSLNIYFETTPFIFYDYYEPRVDGRYSRVFRYYYLNSGWGSDSRKDLRLSLQLIFGDFTERFEGKLYSVSSTIRYRFNDKLNVRYSFRYMDDTYNIGFVNTTADDNIIYGGRELITWENSASVQYLIKNDIAFTIEARHYWNTGNYKQYYDLLEDGDILENNSYAENHNFSYNTISLDCTFSWQFAPGSSINIVYKNNIEQEDQNLDGTYSTNFKRTIDLPNTNSISFKFIYYLDYQNVKLIKLKNSKS